MSSLFLPRVDTISPCSKNTLLTLTDCVNSPPGLDRKSRINPIILYGGSVNDKNITFFSPISEIDGFLIGGASQSAKKFIDIIKNYYK